jgi:hypothetical protein
MLHGGGGENFDAETWLSVLAFISFQPLDIETFSVNCAPRLKTLYR